MLGLLLLGLAVLVPTAACASVPADIEGTWRVAGDDGQGFHWMKEITLSGASYEMQGYPPIAATADISAAENVGERTWKLTLSNYVFNTDPREDEVIEVVLSEDGKTLEINGEAYSKVEPVETP